jgi:hypothetical protein
MRTLISKYKLEKLLVQSSMCSQRRSEVHGQRARVLQPCAGVQCRSSWTTPLTGWPMARNWAAQWHSLAYLNGHSLSFRVTNTDEQTLVFENVALDFYFAVVLNLFLHRCLQCSRRNGFMHALFDKGRENGGTPFTLSMYDESIKDK